MADTDHPSSPLPEFLKEVSRARGRSDDAEDLSAELMRLAADPLLLGTFVDRTRRVRGFVLQGSVYPGDILTVGDHSPRRADVSSRSERFEVDALHNASFFPEPFKPTPDEVAGAVDLSLPPASRQRGEGLALGVCLVVVGGLFFLFVSQVM